MSMITSMREERAVIPSPSLFHRSGGLNPGVLKMALLSRLMRNEKIPEESASSSNDEKLLRLAPQDPDLFTRLAGR